VVIIDDATMQRMHEQFSGIAGTTDVLTFDLSETTDPAGKDPKQTTDIEGEVYVCLDEARRQAVERIHPIERELLLYAVHGLLHLIGYDDHDPQQHRRMHELEDQLLEAIGVGATFGPVDGEQPERNEQAEA
jgi:probable rRNA maturation factor